MYKIRFLSGSDQLRLTDVVRNICYEWVNAWALSNDCLVDVRSVSLNEFKHKQLISYASESSNVPLYISDKNFSWDRFIFGNLEHDSHEHRKYIDLVSRIKLDFINSIFLQKNVLSEREGKNPNHIDTFLCVSIGSPSIGYLEFIAPHSYFIKTLGKVDTYNGARIPGDRFSLVSHIKISVTFKAIFSGLSFSDLIEIKKNAILKSNEAVNNNFLLCINSNPLAYAYIGKQQNCRAYLIKGRKNG